MTRIFCSMFGTALVCSLLLSTQSASAQELKAGAPFPSTWFADATTGAPRNLQEFRGKPLLLHIYASW
jgi:hypothetical protein